MRYDDWDILLFPRDCKIPIKEFKVACHMVHDAEFSHTHGSFGLPTVCCFVPSLPAGSPFQVSIHSWSTPSVSQFTRAYTEFADSVKYEARLYIDGRLVASTSLNRDTCWPHVIAHTCDLSKNGNFELLRFPAFRQELLQQSYWSPADDLGRIKITISEGFPRDSLTMPIERVKNIVTFSFQHAPLDVLEASSIAWPNTSMWQRATFATSMLVTSFPSDDVDSHAHSPRRRAGLAQAGGVHASSRRVTMPQLSTRFGPLQAADVFNLVDGTDGNAADPFVNKGTNTDFDAWMRNAAGSGMRGVDEGIMQQRSARRTSTDISMPDYLPINASGHSSSMSIDPSGGREENGAAHLRVPTNTPTTGGNSGFEHDVVPFPIFSHNSAIPSDLANSLTNSLLNQPMPVHLQHHTGSFSAPAGEMKSRKENRGRPAGPSPSGMAMPSAQDRCEMRRVSQQVYMPPGGSVPVCTLSCPHIDSPQKQECLDNGGGAPEGGGPAGCKAPAGDGALGSSTPMKANASALEKGLKRIRNFTPASARAIDEEDEPRRRSPRIRLTPFAEDKADS